MLNTTNDLNPPDEKTKAKVRMKRRLMIAGVLTAPLLGAVVSAPYWGDWLIARLNRRDGDSTDFITVYKQFLEDIDANRLDVAYHSTTAGFQNRVSRNDFETAVRRYVAFKSKPDTRGIEAESSGPAGGDYRGTNRMVFKSTLEDNEGNKQRVSITIEQQNPLLDRQPERPRISDFQVSDVNKIDDSDQAGSL